MQPQEDQIAYLQALSRRNWGTWAWATAVALAMNLMLFLIMPYLLNRQPAKPVFDQLLSHIDVIRIKQVDSAVRRKNIPPPPSEKRKELPQRPPPRQPVQAKLALPFEINPRLPSGPTTLDLLPLEPAAFHASGMQDAFAIGDLDGPLTPLGRVPPIYPMAAKRSGLQGWVKVKFIVNEQGAVAHISIVEAKPASIFDQSVYRCVSKWRFKPGTVEGVPVKTWVETTIKFELE